MQPRQHFDLPAMEPGALIIDASAWTGADYPDDRSWVHGLDDAMRDEIVTAMGAAKARGIAPKDIQPADFPLPLTAPLLADALPGAGMRPRLRHALGLPPGRPDAEEITLAYCGLCCHLGTHHGAEPGWRVHPRGHRQGQGFQHRSPAATTAPRTSTSTPTAPTPSPCCALETAAEGGRSKLLSAAVGVQRRGARAPGVPAASCTAASTITAATSALGMDARSPSTARRCSVSSTACCTCPTRTPRSASAKRKA